MNREALPWPVGVGDLEEIRGEGFNRDAWLDVGQFFYNGADDQGDPDELDHPREYRHALTFRRLGEERQKLLIDIFGWKQIDERFKTSQEIYNQLESPADFATYDGVGHSVNSEMRDDIIEFHMRWMHEEFGPQFDRTIQWPKDPISVGETVHISISYENLGATESAATPTLLVDGNAVKSTEIRLAPGEDETIEFEHTVTTAGEITLSEDEETLFEVMAEEDEAEATNNSGETEATDSTGAEEATPDVENQPGFGVIQAIAGVGGLAYVLNRYVSDGE